VVQAADLEDVGQLDGVTGALDVERLVALLVGGHVVDRRQVEEMADLPAVLVDPVVVDAQGGGLEVADDDLDPLLRPVRPLGDQSVDLRQRPIANDDVDVPVTLAEERMDEVPTDESRCSRDHVGHARPPS
jgi:hypothetical protein